MARIKVFNFEWPLQNLHCFEASARVGKKQQIGAADGSAEELLDFNATSLCSSCLVMSLGKLFCFLMSTRFMHSTSIVLHMLFLLFGL